MATLKSDLSLHNLTFEDAIKVKGLYIYIPSLTGKP